MKKVTFKYGAMFSKKSLELIKTKAELELAGRSTLVLVPEIETHMKDSKVESRVGLTCQAEKFSLNKPIYIRIEELITPDTEFILIDEAQLMKESHVIELKDISMKHGLNIICYGLKVDFKNRFFEGSQALLTYADSVVEIESKCRYCDAKAIFNIRVNENGERVMDGDTIVIGDEMYRSVCYEHSQTTVK